MPDSSVSRSRAGIQFASRVSSSLFVGRYCMVASRKYSIEEANALLPWLTRTFTEIDDVRKSLGPLHVEVEQLGRRISTNGHGDIDARIREAGQRLEQGSGRIRDLFTSIVEKDIEIRDVEVGLVDFPGDHEGREVWLCWRLGETSVAHWHELNQGFSDRQPL